MLPFSTWHILHDFGFFNVFNKKKMKEMITKIFLKSILFLFGLFWSKTQGYHDALLNFKLHPVLTVRSTRLQCTSSDQTTNIRRESLLKVLRKLHTNGEVHIRDEYDTSEIADLILTHQKQAESSNSQSYELNLIAELCSSLAEAGISSADLGVDAFKVIDALVGSIPTTTLLPMYDNASTTVGLMELLRGLHGMQIRWRTLSQTARANVEAIVAHTLTISQQTYHISSNESEDDDEVGGVIAPFNQKTIIDNHHHKTQLATLIFAMGHLKIAYADLDPSTRHLLGNKSPSAIPTSLHDNDMKFTLKSINILSHC